MEELNTSNPSVDIEESELLANDDLKSSDDKQVDFSNLDNEKIISTLKKLIEESPIQSLKAEIDAAKKVFYERSNEAYRIALEKFNAEKDENEQEDHEFDYTAPLTDEFKEVLNSYKTKRNAFYKDQEKQMNTNLKIKLDLIEELKGLLNTEEKIKETFDHFKSIQERWRETGNVPKSELNNLWNTYHHHVEKFFDYLRINNDLRDIEFKRNLKYKTTICEKTEALSKEKNVNIAFNELQILHNEWKHIGPVGKEYREEIWNRFQIATKIVHKNKNDYYEKRKESFEENYNAKLSLCKQVENLNSTNLEHHIKWLNASNQIKQLKEDWKKIGPISKEQNEKSWTRFITAIKTFNSNQNNFYKTLKKNNKDNLLKKQAIVENAEAIKDSKEWQQTSNTLKALQTEWKNSGITSKKESDQLWKRLQSACNHFFDQLKKHYEAQDKKFEENLKKKEKFLKKVKSFKNSGDGKKDLKSIKEFIKSWKELGKVPRKEITTIETAFRKSIDQLFEKLNIDKAEKRDIQFKSKIQSISENDHGKLEDELYRIQNNAKKCKEDLAILENNISFFKHAKADNPLLKEALKNIEKEKAKYKELQSKIAYIKSL